MHGIKQYIAGILAVLFMAASVGAPIALYRCSVAGKYQTVNCCAEKAHDIYGGSIKALPCMSAIYVSPMKANVAPSFHKTFTACVVMLAVLPDNATSHAVSFVLPGQNSTEYLPPPLLLSSALLI